MQRRRGMRRASRRAGTGATRHVAPGKRRDDLASWALSPLAVERIRLVMLERLEQRSPILAVRDATAVSVQYGLGMRSQEIWALTIGDVAGPRAAVHEVLSYGALDAGKTERVTGPSRRAPIDALLADDLTAWATALAAHGYPTAADDFLLRGDVGGHGAQDGHMTGNQAHKWPGNTSRQPCARSPRSGRDEHRDIVGATPYSLPRGIISLRIRAGEDRQAIASTAAQASRCWSGATRSQSRTSKTMGRSRQRRSAFVPGRSHSPPTSVADYGLPEAMLILTTTVSPFASEPRERRLRLPRAAVDQDFAPPAQPKTRPGTRKIREIPANADVAQLVEHFTRNEGVPGSSPGVGSQESPAQVGFFFCSD